MISLKIYVLLAVTAVFLKPSLGQSCGMRMASRVVNGQNAQRHAWPWQISLRYRGGHICGGSIISNWWILTASHCVEKDRSPRGYSVVVGLHAQRERPGQDQIFGLRRVIMHERYGQLNFDVALLQLNRPIRMSYKAKPVCLPQQGSRARPGSQCYITGWGRTVGGGYGANILQQAMLPVADDRRCSYVNGRLGRVYSDTMICAGGQGRGGCQGDSGGPFVCNEGGRWVLRGAVSWGHEYCRTDYFTVFARVSTFTNWIRHRTGL
ncbi:unnamed protein product [Pocillopora meandrina]|uniref:Peptidase S1 domain-containing protein n=1 Tax=Pocillopora meandrina TaxID=46732 RepID=A0AAU9VU61_9CNID|nr:unnamed protein product [Pocillopora meandrina]